MPLNPTPMHLQIIQPERFREMRLDEIGHRLENGVRHVEATLAANGVEACLRIETRRGEGRMLREIRKGEGGGAGEGGASEIGGAAGKCIRARITGRASRPSRRSAGSPYGGVAGIASLCAVKALPRVTQQRSGGGANPGP